MGKPRADKDRSPFERTPAAAQHEIGLGVFLVANRRVRFTTALGIKGRRSRALASLDPRVFSPECVEVVSGGNQVASWIGSRLRLLGAPEKCRVVSSRAELDDIETALGDALDLVVHGKYDEATFISCIPGVLAYFHGETPRARCILRCRQDQ